jgi:excisionase family DNA binding protein
VNLKKLLTTSEVAAILSCSITTVYKLGEAGEIKRIKVGSGYRYLTESVKELVGNENFNNLTNEEK